MTQWWINDVLLADAGISGMTASFRTQATSQLSFSTVALFDAAPGFAYRADVVIKRGDTLGAATKFFQGKIDRSNRAASPANEIHDYHVVDAWQDLEDTIYQESWKVGAGTFMFPKSVLGLSTTGTQITVATQIANAIAFAASVGVDIAAGTIAGSDVLWPQEVSNISVAEVIRQSLKFYPNHIAWIDYATTPPQLNVTPSTTATLREIDLSGAGIAESLSVSRRDDLMPDAVRIIYTSATVIDSETFRDGFVDQWPTAGPTGGPRVIIAEIPLAGMSMQFQKSPVEVVELPTSTATAVAYLKEKFPVIANVPDADISVTAWTRTLIPETSAETARHALTKVNPNTPRVAGTTLTHLPNELRKGSVADWMRVRVGKVHIAMTVTPSGSAAPASVEAIAKLPKGFSVVATNAATKIYKGCSQFQSGETRPSGLAQTYYTSCRAAYQWEGSVALVEAEAGSLRYHGCRINILGSADTNLTTMNAMVHAVDVDIDSGRTDLSFGPAPHLAPADILEMQRQIRSRQVTWWTTEERDSNQLGSAGGASSKGDTVTPYDTPETILDGGGGGGGGGSGAFYTFRTVASAGDDNGDIYLQGGMVSAGTGNATVAEHKIFDASSSAWGGTAGQHLYLTISGTGQATSGILDPVFNTTTGAITPSVGTVGGNTLPAVGSLSGSCKIDLGTFFTGGFAPAGAGNFNVGYCWGGFTVSRV